MQKSKEEYKKEIIEIITKQGMETVYHAAALSSFGRNTIYRLNLHKDEDVINALSKNRSKSEAEVIKKLKESSNPACLIWLAKYYAYTNKLDDCDESKRHLENVKSASSNIHEVNTESDVSIISLGNKIGKKMTVTG